MKIHAVVPHYFDDDMFDMATAFYLHYETACEAAARKNAEMLDAHRRSWERAEEAQASRRHEHEVLVAAGLRPASPAPTGPRTYKAPHIARMDGRFEVRSFELDESTPTNDPGVLP